jgi:hypothetical protein
MKLDIRQIYFAKEQEVSLEPVFTPLPNLDNPFPERREFYLFERFYREKRHEQADLSGLFSHKFGQKTGLAGEAFIAWVKANPGYDAYFINPFPRPVYRFFNIWEQGEKSHHGLIELAQAAFDSQGYAINLKTFPRTDGQTTCFSNFWVATPAFWDDFMAFALPVYHYMLEEGNAPHYFQPTYHDSEVAIFPFIMERLFTTFVVLHPRYKVLPYPSDPGWAAGPTKIMAQIIDACDRRPGCRNSLGFRLAMDVLSNMTYVKNRNPFFLRLFARPSKIWPASDKAA